MEAAAPVVPELVGDYLPATVAWWGAWLGSPQVAFFAATDWQTLLRLAPLVDVYHRKPEANLAAEIRQTEAKLGGTVSDRDRLGWKISPPSEEPSAVPRGSRSRPDPRKPREAAK